jgi:hypothetical protein
MVKRIASGTLWFIAAGWGFNLLGLITGTPPLAGFAFGAAVGVFVGMDPLHLFWPVEAAAIPALDAVPATGAMRTQV